MNRYIILILLFMAMCILGAIYYVSKKIFNIIGKYTEKISFKMVIFFVTISVIYIVYFKSIFIAMLLYMTLLFIVCDLIKIIFMIFKRENRLKKICRKLYCNGILVLVIAFILMLYAAFNSRNPVVTNYNIQINKQLDTDINIVMISDIHAGITDENLFDKMVKMVNKENPHIICLVGDIFDERSNDEIIEKACSAFSKMKSVYGIYYVNGNHDKGILEKFKNKMENVGVTFLEDTGKLIDNKFYIVGRNDEGMSGSSSANLNRGKISNIIKDYNKKYPIIVLDHRPENIKEAKDAEVDLQLSGHTHAGQLFPGNFFIELVNDVCYGYENDGNYNIVVSSGFGTWGFPVRTGSPCEIVKVILQGKN